MTQIDTGGSVTPIVGTVIEKVQLAQTKVSLKQSHSKLQYGFSNHCSSTTWLFILTETVAEAMDMNSTLHVTFMDAKKAVDVVCYLAILTSLHQQGLAEAPWALFADMYTYVTSRVEYEGHISREITEK